MNDDTRLAFVNNTAITRQDVMNSVDEVLAIVRSTNDISGANTALQSMDRIADITGLAKAKLLAGLYAWWKETADQDDDEFFDYLKVMDKQNPTYARRLIRVWNCQEQFPEEFRSRPVEHQIKVATALGEGYEISKSQWKKILQTSTPREVGEVLLEVKKKQPKKSAISLVMERDGTVTAWKENQPHFVGYLDVKNMDKDEVVANSIERIMTHSGISKQ